MMEQYQSDFGAKENTDGPALHCSIQVHILLSILTYEQALKDLSIVKYTD